MLNAFVPAELAETLVADGLGDVGGAQASGGSFVDLGTAVECALVVLGVGADVVAVTGIRAPLADLVERIRGWRSGAGEGGYTLVATGPGGKAVLSLDAEPDAAAVSSVLAQVYAGSGTP